MSSGTEESGSHRASPADPLLCRCALPPLRPGPGRSREHVRANQRARLQAALIELTAERGYAGLTVRGLSRTSGVSTRTFYVHFANVEDCFASTLGSLIERIEEDLTEAMAQGLDRRGALRGWIRALARWAAHDPHAAALVLADSYDGGPAVLQEIGAAASGLERALLTTPVSQSPVLARVTLVGVAQVFRARIKDGRQRGLARLADDLAAWAASVSVVTEVPSMSLARQHRESTLPRDAFGRGDPGFAVFEAIGGDRGRVLAAVARLSAAGEYRSLTPPRVRREAGVSRRNFNALFDDVETCLLEAIELLATDAARRAADAIHGDGDWRLRIGRFALAFCSEVSTSPVFARLAFVDLLMLGSAAAYRRDRLLRRAARWLGSLAPGPQPWTGLATEASLAGCWWVIRAELRAAGPPIREEIPALLTALILLGTC